MVEDMCYYQDDGPRHVLSKLWSKACVIIRVVVMCCSRSYGQRHVLLSRFWSKACVGIKVMDQCTYYYQSSGWRQVLSKLWTNVCVIIKVLVDGMYYYQSSVEGMYYYQNYGPMYVLVPEIWSKACIIKVMDQCICYYQSSGRRHVLLSKLWSKAGNICPGIVFFLLPAIERLEGN